MTWSAQSVRRILSLSLLLLGANALLVACGDDGGEGASTTTALPVPSSTLPPPLPELGDPTTSVPAPVTAESVPPESGTTDALGNDLTCGGAGVLAQFLMDYANLNTPVPGIEYLVNDVVISTQDPTWGRGQVSAPPDSGVEGFVGIAQCTDLGEGPAWALIDSGTSGVGCAAEVPDDLGVEC
jgi:hypothetical protein